MATQDTPWLEEIASWFANRNNARRFEKVMGYTGCRELWLQAELAMWLEHHNRLAPDGDWDTNLLITNYGRSDLGIRASNGELELALEIKVLGGMYQPKVLTGSAGTLKSFVTKLRECGWKVEPRDLDEHAGFSLLADYLRLRTLGNTRMKLLLLVVDNRKGATTDLGEALAKMEFPSTATRTQEIATGLSVRLWQLE